MSSETIEWLNENTRIGFAGKRGKAWHYREGAGNHFDDAVPLGEVEDLFGFTFEPRPIGYMSADGEWVEVGERQAWVRSDTGYVGGIFSAAYEGHQYRPWLLDQVATLIDDELQIGSAGLLRGGAQAWVQIEMPESVSTPEGVEFRPHLLATTSFDGSLATTYKRVATIVVCDNTRTMALGEKSDAIKVKHTKYSKLRLTDARAALEIVHSMADVFSAEVAELCATTVTDAQWERFVQSLAPVDDEIAKAGITRNLEKRDVLERIYRVDERAAPWAGTAYGALQAANTYQLHETQVRKGAHRWERIMAGTLSGQLERNETETRELLMSVL